MCPREDVHTREYARTVVFGKNIFLEKCIETMKILQSIYKYIYIYILYKVFHEVLRGLSCWSCNVHTSVQMHPQYVACPHSRTTSMDNRESTDRSRIIHSACIVVWQQLVIISCSLFFFPNTKNIVHCPEIMSCNSHSVLSRRPRTMLPNI